VQPRYIYDKCFLVGVVVRNNSEHNICRMSYIKYCWSICKYSTWQLARMVTNLFGVPHTNSAAESNGLGIIGDMVIQWAHRRLKSSN
jgi:hypothetical protein